MRIWGRFPFFLILLRNLLNGLPPRLALAEVIRPSTSQVWVGPTRVCLSVLGVPLLLLLLLHLCFFLFGLALERSESQKQNHLLSSLSKERVISAFFISYTLWLPDYFY